MHTVSWLYPLNGFLLTVFLLHGKEHTLLVDWSEKSLIQIVTVRTWSPVQIMQELLQVYSTNECTLLVHIVCNQGTPFVVFSKNTRKGAFNLGTCIQTTILLVLCLTLLSCFFQTSPSRSNSPSFVVERCWPKCLISANACSLLCCESCRHSCCGNFTSERSWHFCQVIKGGKKQKI